MKLISWNVNGIRAAIKHGLMEFINQEQADIYCFQEIKTSQKLSHILENIKISACYDYWHLAKKKGYSGVAVFSKIKPKKVVYGLGNKKIDNEGRVLTLDFGKFYLVNAYFPHSTRELKRLEFKLFFNKRFLQFSQKLVQAKPIIIAGDLNVAHQERDLANPKENKSNAGFTKSERDWMDKFLHKGFVDTFRIFNQKKGNHTWWTWRNDARARNIGWRIDYIITSRKIKNAVLKSYILKDIFGSDHCPIGLEINL